MYWIIARCCDRRLRVLLAEIPVECELIAEPRDQFTNVQTPLAAGVPAVERHRHGTRHWRHQPATARSTAALCRRRSLRRRCRRAWWRRRGCRWCAGRVPRRWSAAAGRCTACGCGAPAPTATAAAKRAVVVLRLLEFEVQVDPARLRVIEHDLPLIELRDVVVELVVAIDEGPHVVAVPSRVVRQEGHRVHALRREVVDGADQALCPCRSSSWGRRPSSPGRAERRCGSPS